jgi:hypothetical protein
MVDTRGLLSRTVFREANHWRPSIERTALSWSSADDHALLALRQWLDARKHSSAVHLKNNKHFHTNFKGAGKKIISDSPLAPSGFTNHGTAHYRQQCWIGKAKKGIMRKNKVTKPRGFVIARRGEIQHHLKERSDAFF